MRILMTVGSLTAAALAIALAFGAGPGSADKSQAPSPAATTSTPSKWPVNIRTLDGPPTVTATVTNATGELASIGCSTCHATTAPNPLLSSADELDEFHQGLKFQHGSLTCLSCHNENDYESLKLAGGALVPYAHVMDLCAQCHGPQARDYKNGSHGGMTGYWDLRRGPRSRNNCVDCHDPHAPAYPTVMPVFPPRDRTPAGASSAPETTH